MKKFFVFAMLCCMTLFVNAQATDVPMATLQHGDEIKVFYGKTALSQAYTAAADSGDVITLSAGVFDGLTIQKSLKIIGNGFVTDEEKGIYPTVIKGDLNYSSRDVVNSDGETIKDAIGYDGTRLEGLEITGNFVLRGRGPKGFEIVKCKQQTYGVSFHIRVNTENLSIRQSVFSNIFFSDNSLNHIQHNLNIINSIFMFYNAYNNASTIYVDHSIILTGMPIGNVSNSILTGASPGVTANNCIFIEKTPSEILGTGNWFNKKLAGIFEEEMTDMGWDGVKTFKLKYPDTYVGTDGTQVGLYGGTYPFNPTPTVPQITESEIDTKVAADGKLKVRITVEAQTEY